MATKVKSPRDYASELIQLATWRERHAALKHVPEADRALVREHVKNHFGLAEFRKDKEAISK